MWLALILTQVHILLQILALLLARRNIHSPSREYSVTCITAPGTPTIVRSLNYSNQKGAQGDRMQKVLHWSYRHPCCDTSDFNEMLSRSVLDSGQLTHRMRVLVEVFFDYPPYIPTSLTVVHAYLTCIRRSKPSRTTKTGTRNMLIIDSTGNTISS